MDAFCELDLDPDRSKRTEQDKTEMMESITLKTQAQAETEA